MRPALSFLGPALAITMACSSSSSSSSSSSGGSSSGGSSLASASIGAQGGSVTVSAAESATLAGTSITVPAGALSQDVTIAILSSSASVTASGEQAAGPVVDFEPSGTMFTSPVTMTIPVTLPSGASTSSLKIAAVEPDGTRQELAVQSVTGGLATFQASGFTGFGPVIPGPTMSCATNADCPAGQVCVSGACKAE
ncbi:MAG: hypothetical protein ABSE49_00830 [Polyangiaceae bacterium]